MPIDATPQWNRIQRRLEMLYPHQTDHAQRLLKKVLAQHLADSPATSEAVDPEQRWSEKDVVLITYGDQVRSESLPPLRSLLSFLTGHDLFRWLRTVHFLPCFPYSSDDGFSVIDYRQVDPELGTWADLEAYREHGRLMLDFVVNHISQHSSWFQAYQQGRAPYDHYFIEADPQADLSAVTRPRSLPLLSEFDTAKGKRWLWTTFSRDQLDLNYAEPAVLAEIIDILLEYVAHGARIIRMDAIAYLWKQVGTNCIHLPETHEVVKLFRDVLELLAPDVLILTETNVPHDENVRYFGAGDEAHMVYQFSLPPLLLDAFLNDDAIPLKRWLSQLEQPRPGTTYFNFTASHDGVGVRPLEGHVDESRLNQLVEKIKNRGGLVGTRRRPDGSDSPYELNISYVDALGCDQPNADLHVQRFLASQAIMLALQGMPAIYFHSLVGTQNDLEGVAASGIPRRINRRKFQRDELEARIVGDSLQARIFAGMNRLLEIRTQQPAFHPQAEQRYHESHSDQVLSFVRLGDGQAIFVAANFSDEEQVLELPSGYSQATDLLDYGSDASNRGDGRLRLEPAQVVWLARIS